MIEIPKIAKPDSGMVCRKGIWYAVFYVDNKTRTRSLGTGDKEEARAARDAFFASLAAQGAATRSVRTKAAAGSDAYIHERPRFVVRVPGRKLRYAASIEHAREIRDGMLGANDERIRGDADAGKQRRTPCPTPNDCMFLLANEKS